MITNEVYSATESFKGFSLSLKSSSRVYRVAARRLAFYGSLFLH